VNMDLPGKQIEIAYDEAGYYLIVMRLKNGEAEVLETHDDIAGAEDLAYRFTLPGMPYVSANRCRDCGRNMQWTLVPLPEERCLCEICSLGENEKTHCCNCGIPMRIGWGSLCSDECRYMWNVMHDCF